MRSPPSDDEDQIILSDGSVDPDAAFCRICLSTEDPELLFAPCRCKGSCMHVHRYCLDQWHASLMEARPNVPFRCPACLYTFRTSRLWMHELMLRNAVSFASVTTLFLFLLLGRLWHVFDGYHAILAYGIDPHQLGSNQHHIRCNVPNEDGMTDVPLHQAPCLFTPMECGPSGMLSLFSAVAPFTAFLLSSALEGVLVYAVALTSVLNEPSTIFLAVQVATYFCSGSLYPFALLDVIQSCGAVSQNLDAPTSNDVVDSGKASLTIPGFSLSIRSIAPLAFLLTFKVPC
ncbi:hypothetical protein DFJ73DRAFT_821501 [Zopfochytrium polystomum]|nr:hypothetical protein DFJ73DRAFT_821501 [Zopfochytrium polystomum]